MQYEGRVECAVGYQGNLGNGAKAAAYNLPAPTRATETDSAFERQCGEVASAEDALSTLVSRLGSVLRPNAETAGKDRACIGYASSLAGRIGGQADRVETITQAIRNVLDRLEV